ncbi:MAG: hypothetical protein O3B45_06855, partial [Bacteroidetes bacterium]|nr:hypothetical protein [Bacteroidota bacterium]
IADASVANVDLQNDNLTIGTTNIVLGATETELRGLGRVDSDKLMVNPLTATETFDANVAFEVQDDAGGTAMKVNTLTGQTTLSSLYVVGTTTWFGDMDVTGDISTSGIVSSADQPTDNNHLTRKDYVDGYVDGLVLALQTELNDTQTGAGLNTAGNYIVDATTNYLTAATSLADADDKLDAQAKTNADGIATLDNTTVKLSGNQTILGAKTFSSTIGGSIDGNAATVTNGVYTTSSVTVLADVTSVGSGAIITGTERTKLNGIEALADVTDATNVTAAGALMDSEVTDLAGVKAVTISTLQVKPSEGAFVNGDKTKLDGIEALADVTDAVNVAAAGAVMTTGNYSIAGVKTFSSTIGGSIDGNAATVTNGRYTTDAQVFDYTVTSNQTNATDGNTYDYFLNGANVFYQHESAGDADANATNGYEFTLVGSNLPTSITLYLRGQANVIAVAADKFSLTYNDVVAMAGASGQTSGGMVLNLVVDGMHTGVQFHFHLDDTSTAPDTNF